MAQSEQATGGGRPRRGSGVTHDAIESIRELIASGQWGPGTRLPREADLAAQLGLSRNSLREAVRALSLARVLEVRQGDGTYVSSLEPDDLLEPTRFATHLLRGRTVLELFEVRRMLEPEAAAMAALRADDEIKTALRFELDRMYAAGDRVEELVEADAAFHDVIGQAPGNAVLRSLLQSLSTRTVRARLWHGMADRVALDTRARRAHAHLRGDRRRRRRSRARRDDDAHRKQRDVAARASRPDRRRPAARHAQLMDAAASVRIGSTGVAVTRFGLGCAPLGGLYESVSDEQARATVDRAWELGVRYFDTAPLYGSGLSEQRAGAALRDRPRDEFVLSTKVGRLLEAGGSADPMFEGAPAAAPVFDFSYDGALRSLEASLERLGLDRVDIALDPRSGRPLRGGARGRVPRACAAA